MTAPKKALPMRASEYYVDASSGSDSNPGSLSSPFLTIQHAVYHVPPSPPSPPSPPPLPPSPPSPPFFFVLSRIHFEEIRDVAVRDATIYLRAVSLLPLPPSLPQTIHYNSIFSCFFLSSIFIHLFIILILIV